MKKKHGQALTEFNQEIRKKNVNRVIQYYQDNLFCTQSMCADGLGISRQTVNYIVQALRKLKESSI